MNTRESAFIFWVKIKWASASGTHSFKIALQPLFIFFKLPLETLETQLAVLNCRFPFLFLNNFLWSASRLNLGLLTFTATTIKWDRELHLQWDHHIGSDIESISFMRSTVDRRCSSSRLLIVTLLTVEPKKRQRWRQRRPDSEKPPHHLLVNAITTLNQQGKVTIRPVRKKKKKKRKLGRQSGRNLTNILCGAQNGGGRPIKMAWEKRTTSTSFALLISTTSTALVISIELHRKCTYHLSRCDGQHTCTP